MKDGWRTTEFWFSLVVAVGPHLSNESLPGWVRWLGSALAAVGYAHSRGQAKRHG